MAIVPLKKLTFCGLVQHKEAVLRALQALAALHPIALNNADGGQRALKNYDEAYRALQFLCQCPQRRHQVKNPDDFELERVIERVLALQAEMLEKSNRRDTLITRIRELEPWGNFNLPEAERLAGLKLWFYIVPKRLMKQLPTDHWPWQVVYQDNLRSYVVVIAAGEPPASVMPVPRTHTGSVSLAELQAELNRVELSLEDLQAERESLTRWISALAGSLAEAENHAALQSVQAMTRDMGPLFVLQGWAAATRLSEFESFATEHGLALLAEDPAPGELPPTLLHNPPSLAGGENVVQFYQTPNYHAWDPSLVVFFSFALFFAMILSDAGYAAVFALLLVLKWRHLQSPTGRRLRMLAAVTLGVSLGWGVVVGSYFGVTPAPDSPFAALQAIDLNDFDAMIKISVSIGALHLLLANAITLWQRRCFPALMTPLAWMLMISGGYTAWLGQETPQAWLRQSGYALMGLGAVTLLMFASERPVQRAVDVFWRLLDGVKSLTKVTQMFGDILSYMRLFALGLASASLALTFNQLASQVYHAVSGPGLLFAILILLIGHALNLVLCLISGVVHGLRLNFIEFYNWSVFEEGYSFKAFSKKMEIHE